MSTSHARGLEVTAWIMVSLMVLLQASYAVYATIDPAAFADLRGTDLLASGDADWVIIYASRTLFVALIIGFLLVRKHYKLLVWAALFGTVMPIVDAVLAYNAGAENAVIYKHLATVIYLIVTAALLSRLVSKQTMAQHS